MRRMYESKGRPAEKKIPTVVVYKKPTGKNHYLLITEDNIDSILAPSKRKPTLPDNYEIVDIGLGESFINSFKELYKIK